MATRQYYASDALRYLRETGDQAGAKEILKAAVKLPANIPQAYKPASPVPQMGAPVAKPPAPAPIRSTPSPASPPVAARPPAPPQRAVAASMGPQRAVTQRASRFPPAAPQSSMGPSMGGMPRPGQMEMAKGGKVQAYAKGGSVSSRGDGCAQRGKTKGRMV